ncbi:hypothetical protein NA57DRAFT_74410 [Rhizodiscina lignyota]|uniref:Uncharacterized protein n=1 Tax=Rhizodiscina lignyota TaxID=1504668 RepID=A0A9P4M7T0_9PEZI|nr:hypothetical protein NA57DRAFT_74410 [Rhizodiscina lignyota]
MSTEVASNETPHGPCRQRQVNGVYWKNESTQIPVYYDVRSIDDMLSLIRTNLSRERDEIVPDTVQLDVLFNPGATLAIEGLQPTEQSQSSASGGPPAGNAPEVKWMTTVEILSYPQDLEDWRKFYQTVAKSFVRSIADTDGYSYSMRQFFLTKGGEVRTRYVCKDSTQNRDRVSSSRISRKKTIRTDGTVSKGRSKKRQPAVDAGDPTSSRRLPTYECKGYISVDFCTTAQTIKIRYRHLPIHRAVGNSVNLRNEHQQDAPDLDG